MTAPPDELPSDQHDEPPADAAEADAPAAVEPAERNREAERYRRQAREAQSERDALGARLEALQRNEIGRLAVGHRLLRPESIWATGATVGDFLDTSGNVDPCRVAEIADQAVETLGLARTDGPPALEGGPRTTAAPPVGWADVLRQGRG